MELRLKPIWCNLEVNMVWFIVSKALRKSRYTAVVHLLLLRLLYIMLVNLCKLSLVDLFGRKPSWFSYKMFSSNRYFRICLCITFSVNLASRGRIEIGLRLFTSVGSPPFGSGVTVAIFHLSGKMLFVITKSMMCFRW